MHQLIMKIILSFLAFVYFLDNVVQAVAKNDFVSLFLDGAALLFFGIVATFLIFQYNQKKMPFSLGEPGDVCPNCGLRNFEEIDFEFRTGKALIGTLFLGNIGMLNGFRQGKKRRLECLDCGHRWTSNRSR